MANFAALIQSLVISGSRKSDGTANAGGKVYAYLPDTSTSVNLYADASAETIVTQPITLDAGGRISRSDYPDGVFCKQAVRLVVQTSDGAMVSDSVYVPSTAGATGYDPDQTNAAFTRTNVNDILQDAGLSFGGLDWYYKESAGATSRTVKAKLLDGGISVKDFGAKGDGVAIDTTAIQSALNRAKALSVPVLFPKTNAYYKIDQALTLSSATGVSILAPVGTKIKTTHGTANLFTFTGCTGFAVQGLTLRASGVSTGTAIALIDSSTVTISNVDIGTDTTDYFTFGITSSVSTGIAFGITIVGGAIDTSGGGAGHRCIRLTDTNTAVIGGNIFLSSGSGVAVEYAGATRDVVAGPVIFAAADVAATGLKFTAGLTGKRFSISQSPTAGSAWSAATMTLPFDLSGLATDPDFRQWGNNVDGYVVSQASGGGGGSTVTPDRSKGKEVHVRLTSGGAAVLTVAAPTPVPLTTMRDVRLTFRITAAAGGNITARFNAVYLIVGGGTDIVVTDTNTYTVEFNWDVQVSKWRECFRALTVT